MQPPGTMIYGMMNGVGQSDRGDRPPESERELGSEQGPSHLLPSPPEPPPTESPGLDWWKWILLILLILVVMGAGGRLFGVAVIDSMAPATLTATAQVQTTETAASINDTPTLNASITPVITTTPGIRVSPTITPTWTPTSTLPASAVNVSGEWNGYINRDTEQQTIVRMSMKQEGSRVTGLRTVIDVTSPFNGVIEFVGTVSGNIVSYDEINIVDDFESGSVCLLEGRLHWSIDEEGNDILYGPVSLSTDSTSDCTVIDLWLERIPLRRYD